MVSLMAIMTKDMAREATAITMMSTMTTEERMAMDINHRPNTNQTCPISTQPLEEETHWIYHYNLARRREGQIGHPG